MTEEKVAPKKEKIPRQKMPEQDPKVRARNFQEVPTGYTPNGHEGGGALHPVQRPPLPAGLPRGNRYFRLHPVHQGRGF